MKGPPNHGGRNVGAPGLDPTSLSEMQGGVNNRVQTSTHEGMVSLTDKILKHDRPPIFHGETGLVLFANSEGIAASTFKRFTCKQSRLNMKRVEETGKIVRVKQCKLRDKPIW